MRRAVIISICSADCRHPRRNNAAGFPARILSKTLIM